MTFTYCEPSNIYFNMVMSMSDCFFLLIYLVLNNYMWPVGGVAWCTVPKIAWSIALYYYHTDRTFELLVAFGTSVVFNLIHLVVCEEILLAVHRGQKGRMYATGESVEKPDSKDVVELRPLALTPVCKYTTIEFYVAINMDIIYIFKMAKLNL